MDRHDRLLDHQSAARRASSGVPAREDAPGSTPRRNRRAGRRAPWVLAYHASPTGRTAGARANLDQPSNRRRSAPDLVPVFLQQPGDLRRGEAGNAAASSGGTSNSCWGRPDTSRLRRRIRMNAHHARYPVRTEPCPCTETTLARHHHQHAALHWVAACSPRHWLRGPTCPSS